jgi:outer membrane lipoprotein carrier protein
MKVLTIKRAIFTVLLPACMLLSIAPSAMATDTSTLLKAKLNAVQGFSADFNQQVIDTDGNIIQTATGTLAVKRPNLLNWETKAPDETLVVSDGKTLWFYNPFVEQVSAFNISNAVTNTPILLLTGLADEAWQDYQVTQTSDNEFSIESLNEDAQVKNLHLLFNKNDLIKFTVEDATGQLSHFHLSNVINTPLPAAALFQFTLPEGVDFDDQR